MKVVTQPTPLSEEALTQTDVLFAAESVLAFLTSYYSSLPKRKLLKKIPAKFFYMTKVKDINI